MAKKYRKKAFLPLNFSMLNIINTHFKIIFLFWMERLMKQGNRILSWRKEKKMTREALAKQLEISSSTLFRIEQNKADIGVNLFQKACHIFGKEFQIEQAMPSSEEKEKKAVVMKSLEVGQLVFEIKVLSSSPIQIIIGVSHKNHFPLDSVIEAILYLYPSFESSNPLAIEEKMQQKENNKEGEICFTYPSERNFLQSIRIEFFKRMKEITSKEFIASLNLKL